MTRSPAAQRRAATLLGTAATGVLVAGIVAAATHSGDSSVSSASNGGSPTASPTAPSTAAPAQSTAGQVTPSTPPTTTASSPAAVTAAPLLVVTHVFHAYPDTDVDTSEPEGKAAAGQWIVHWVAVVRNPNAAAYAAHPVVVVNGRDEHGKIIGTEHADFLALPPGATVPFSGQMVTSEKPSHLELSAAAPAFVTPAAPASAYVVARGTGVHTARYKKSWLVTGQFANRFGPTLQTAAVTALLYDRAGRLSAGWTNFVDVNGASTVKFRIQVNDPRARADHVVVTAVPWGDAQLWNQLVHH